jgi:hypothetical protein
MHDTVRANSQACYGILALTTWALLILVSCARVAAEQSPPLPLDASQPEGQRARSDYLNFLATQGRLEMENMARSHTPMRTVYQPDPIKRAFLWLNLVALGCLFLCGVVRYWHGRRRLHVARSLP